MSYPLLADISNELLRNALSFQFERNEIISSLEPQNRNVTLLKGARGIGKSTAILQFLAKKAKAGERVFYVSADSALLNLSLSELALEFSKRGGGYLAIDEIHSHPHWGKEVKTIIDSFPSIKAIASGSCALELDSTGGDLSRRHVMVQAAGLSFREYVDLKHSLILPKISLQDLTDHYAEVTTSTVKIFSESKVDLLAAFHEYLRKGYFISHLNFNSDTLYYSSLIQSINTIIDSDIPAVHKEIDTNGRIRIKELLKIVAHNCPFTPNITELGRALGMSNDNTLKKYLYYLNKSEIITGVYSELKSHKDFPRPKKLLLANTNYIYAFAKNPEIGTVREAFAANILRQLGTISYPKVGDLLFDGKFLFEIGGKSKTRKQIPKNQNNFVLADNILIAEEQKIPLWILGLLW